MSSSVGRATVNPGTSPPSNRALSLATSAVGVSVETRSRPFGPSQLTIVAASSRPPSVAGLATGARPVSLKDLDRRGLARSVGAEEREALAARDVEVEALDRDLPAVCLAQPADADRRFTCHAAQRATSGPVARSRERGPPAS